MNTFEELGCYAEGRILRQLISSFCRSLPPDERFRLKDQLIRASRSITANIAEGYGRHHHQENMQFCRQARGSLSETLDHLSVALDEAYLTVEEFQILRNQVETTWKVLNGYIAYLTRCAASGVPAAKG